MEKILGKMRDRWPVRESWLAMPFVGIAMAICLHSTLSFAVSKLPGNVTSSETNIEKGKPYILIGAGDVAGCDDLSGARETAKLLAQIPGTIFVDGDLAYPDGTLAEFESCYGPTWGRFKARTRPALGNHEYETKNAKGYFEYFGPRAGPAGEGYYSYDLGSWHIVVLNANCENVPGGCTTGSPEETWLRADLLKHPSECTLAYFHQPLFSSSEVGNYPAVKPFWEDLYRAGTSLVVNGHAHDYERFSPQDPDGVADSAHGILEIIAGTGGKDHAHFIHIDANSLVRDSTAFGVLKLTLYPGKFDWNFISAAGSTFTDLGSGFCHGH